MPKQRSHLRLEGTIGETTYYKGKDGEYRVKLKSGVSKSTLMTSPKFARMRAQMSETKEVAKIARQFYKSISYASRDIGGSAPFLTLRSTLRDIQVKDNTAKMGERKSETALMVPENRVLLNKTEFNPEMSLSKLTGDAFTVDMVNASIHFEKVSTDSRLVRPLEAHKLGFNALWINVVPDEKEGFTTTHSFAPEVMIPLDGKDHEVKLETGGVTPAEGFSLMCLSLKFYTVEDVYTYPILNTKSVAAGIVGVN